MTPGFSDAFGTRQLMFDPSTSTSLEVLRFTRRFSESPDFEGALLARVEALQHIRHASLASALSVERVSDSELALVSRHVAGRRVSELLPKAHGPAFAIELIRLVTPALAALQRSGEDVVHGALSAERIVVTRDGRLVVVEHVLGSALEAMGTTREQMHALGLIAPAGAGPVQLTPRTDVAQMAFIALSLLLGRHLNAADHPDKVLAYLDEYSRTSSSPIRAAKLRMWLERALQLSPRSFATAAEAQAALGELPDDAEVHAPPPPPSPPVGLDAFPPEETKPIVPEPEPTPEPVPVQTAVIVEEPIDRRGPVADRRAPKPRKGRKIGSAVVVILALLAAGTAAALFVVPYFSQDTGQTETATPVNPVADLRAEPSPTPVSVFPDPASLDLTPTETPAPTQTPAAESIVPAAGGAAVSPTTTPVEPPPSTSPAASNDRSPANTAGPAPTAPAQGPSPAAETPARFGGMTVKSPMDLQVLENGTPIGSTAGPIAIGAGTRTVEFVNETVGFRYRQTVTIKAGQMTTVNIAVPNGKVSINAAPWAEVDIDGTPAGETPLANLSLPVGTHEITFRHPQFGTKKQTIVVKAEGLTKVTQVFQQEQQR